MYSGHIVFTREYLGEVVCIGQSFHGVDNRDDRPHATSFNTALADFLLEQQVNEGQVFLWTGIYDPIQEEKFCGGCIDVTADVLQVLMKRGQVT